MGPLCQNQFSSERPRIMIEPDAITSIPQRSKLTQTSWIHIILTSLYVLNLPTRLPELTVPSFMLNEHLRSAPLGTTGGTSLDLPSAKTHHQICDERVLARSAAQLPPKKSTTDHRIAFSFFNVPSSFNFVHFSGKSSSQVKNSQNINPSAAASVSPERWETMTPQPANCDMDAASMAWHATTSSGSKPLCIS